MRWLLLRRISPDGVFTMYDLGSSVCRITVPLPDFPGHSAPTHLCHLGCLRLPWLDGCDQNMISAFLFTLRSSFETLVNIPR